MTPFDCEHNKVEGVHWFHLAPRFAASTSEVWRVGGLDHHTLVSRGECLSKQLFSRLRRTRDFAGNHALDDDEFELLPSFGQGGVDEIVSVQMQDVEEPGGKPNIHNGPEVDVLVGCLR